MNAKTAKKLRRLAERATIGAPARVYERNLNGTRRNAPRGSTRGVYLSLKRAVAMAKQ